MSQMQMHEYRVEMTCDGCSGAVQRVLSKLKGNGVEKVEISLADQRVKVTSSLSADEILQIIKKTGKTTEYLSSSSSSS